MANVKSNTKSAPNIVYLFNAIALSLKTIAVDFIKPALWNSVPMGDSFFKAFFISCFVLLFIVGAFLFLQLQRAQDDAKAERAYLNSRGKAPVPSSWEGKVGKGI